MRVSAKTSCCLWKTVERHQSSNSTRHCSGQTASVFSPSFTVGCNCCVFSPAAQVQLRLQQAVENVCGSMQGTHSQYQMFLISAAFNCIVITNIWMYSFNISTDLLANNRQIHCFMVILSRGLLLLLPEASSPCGDCSSDLAEGVYASPLGAAGGGSQVPLLWIYPE